MALLKSEKLAGRFWGAIFRIDGWIKSVEGQLRTRLCLVGSDLIKWNEVSTPIYLALLANDWNGDTRYTMDEFFESLQEHTYDEERDEVYFPKSNITLNIHDLTCNLDIRMEDPRRLFSEETSESMVLYYDHPEFHNLSGSDIGRLRVTNSTELEIPSWRRGNVDIICSLRLEWAEDDDMSGPLYRVFHRAKPPPFHIKSLERTDDQIIKWEQCSEPDVRSAYWGLYNG